MLKLNDVCICHEQLVELLGVCVCFSGEKEEEMTVRPPSRCLLFQTVVIFGFCLLLLLKQMVGLATVMLC